MSDLSFGPAALRLSGIAAHLLGWRPDEFWKATPAELAGALCLAEEAEAWLDRAELEALAERFPDDRGQ